MSAYEKTTHFPIRGVHLDLKGLVPTYSRLLELLKLFASSDYNAIFIEWEDMFPWAVDNRFRSTIAYSKEQLKEILRVATSLGIQVIPLTQCFGHMENFLKFDTYASLREQSNRTDCINPLAKGASDFVISLIQDVLDIMPEVSYFHIGGDEVWTLGENSSTRSFVRHHSEAKLFLHHVKPILKYLCSRDIRPIIWHDMLRNWDKESLSEIVGLADVMIWDYSKPPLNKKLSSMKYISIFKDLGINLWGATAFKGADGHSSDMPIFENRYGNAKLWYEIAENIEFKGAVATGWNRYSTDQVQCEPIDVALDSLVAIGQVLNKGFADNYMKIIESNSNLSIFNNCSSVLKEFAHKRTECWYFLQLVYELCSVAKLDKNRRGSGVIKDKLSRLSEEIKKLEILSQRIVDAFDGLIEPVCLNKYVAERLDAIVSAMNHIQAYIISFEGTMTEKPRRGLTDIREVTFSKVSSEREKISKK